MSVHPRTTAFAALLVACLASAIIVAATPDDLIKAVREGNIEAARALLKQRVDVNAPQGDGATALHWAVQLDDLNTAEFLLRAGARADAANDTGVTPLYLACMNRNAVLVEKLLAAGANPNAALLEGRDRSHDVRPFGKRLSGEGAPDPWRRCERNRGAAQPERVDVGSRSAAS